MIRQTASFGALALVACTPSPERPAQAAPAPTFDVFGFFAGRSHGDGLLKIASKRAVAVHVSSEGRVEGDTLVLDQRIVEGVVAPDRNTPPGPPRDREWRIHEVSPERYAGTLSDAAGPVTGEVAGNRLILRFRMKGGLDATQWLYLQPGGRVALNGMAVSKWGVRIATLDERIEKD